MKKIVLLFHWLCRSWRLARFKVKSKHINTNVPISFQITIYKQYFEISECRLSFKALFHKIWLPVLLRPLYVESFVETWGGQVSKSRGAITRKLWPEIDTISRKIGILWHRATKVGSLKASTMPSFFFVFAIFAT